MYIAIGFFWVVGMLFCFGFHIDELKGTHNTFKMKFLLAMSRELWFAWPFWVGRTLRQLLDKNLEN